MGWESLLLASPYIYLSQSLFLSLPLEECLYMQVNGETYMLIHDPQVFVTRKVE